MSHTTLIRFEREKEREKRFAKEMGHPARPVDPMEEEWGPLSLVPRNPINFQLFDLFYFHLCCTVHLSLIFLILWSHLLLYLPTPYTHADHHFALFIFIYIYIFITSLIKLGLSKKKVWSSWLVRIRLHIHSIFFIIWGSLRGLHFPLMYYFIEISLLWLIFLRS